MGDCFCGWYFRCQTGDRALALIPAVHEAGGNRSGSIQLITEEGNWNIPFFRGGIRVDREHPQAGIGDSRFSEAGIELELHGKGLSATGSLRFQELSPIRYDIMGPFQYLPFMECRHSVCSMRHRVDGKLTVNGTELCFQNGTGYIEGDRGRSFPRHYVWTQCFFEDGSLMLSAAEIPLGPVRFTGVISVIQWRDREYRLATYLGARPVEIRRGVIVVRQGAMTLTARLLQKNARPLQAPARGAMTRTIRESVACRAWYRLQKGGETLFSFETEQAAFEYEYPF